jgi:hypothetical protein
MTERFVLFVGDDTWRIARVGGDEVQVTPVGVGADVTADAEAAASRLAELGHDGGPVALALPSAWCLCATVATDGLERAGRRQAMAFRLEEHLPISAEDFVADFVDQGDAALGVCSDRHRLTAIIAALESVGVNVGAICPAALLAAGGVARGTDRTSVVVLADAGGWDVIAQADAGPTTWRWLGDDPAAARETASSLLTATDTDAPLLVAGDEASAFDHLALAQRLDGAVAEIAARRAAEVLAGDASPWVDLRRDALAAPGRGGLYRRPIAGLVVAAIVLLAAVWTVAELRGRAYLDRAREHRTAQVGAFRRALPDQRPPRSIVRRLRSEHRRLAGLGGQETGYADLAASQGESALAHLRHVLGQLPGDLRWRIVDLSIRPDRVRVSGEARSHAEAERIALAARASGRYDVDPPETHALAGRGVSFRFTVRPRHDAAPVSGEAP